MYKPFILALIVVTLVLSAGNLPADDTAILPILPPETNKPQVLYNGYGILQAIEDNDVIIDDMLFHRGSGFTFRDWDGSLSSSTEFPAGIRVWYVLYPDDAENTIESLWKEGG